VVERIKNEQQHYQAICDELGYSLKVIKQQPLSSQYVDDNTRYDFYTIIHGYETRVSFIDSQKTLFKIKSMPIDSFNFFTVRAGPYTRIFQPWKCREIKSTIIEFGGSNKKIITLVSSSDILNGLTEMSTTTSINAIQLKSNDNIIDDIDCDLNLTIHNVPLNSHKLEKTLKSISLLVERLI